MLYNRMYPSYLSFHHIKVLPINPISILYAAPFFLTGLSAIIVAFRLRRLGNIYGFKWILLLLIASAVWSLGQAVEYLSPDLTVKIFWDNVQWVGILIIPPAFLLLTMEFTGWDRWIKPLSILIIIVVPALSLIVFYTNFIHHYTVSEYRLIFNGGFIGLQKDYTAGFYLFLGYSYFLLALGFLSLVWLSIRSPKYYGNQIRWTMFAALITVVFSLFDAYEWAWSPYFQPTALAMSAFCLVAASNMSRLRKMDIRKASRDLSLSIITDPFFLISGSTNILEMNPAAQNLIGKTASEAIGQPLSKAAPDIFAQVFHLLEDGSTAESSAVEIKAGSYSYQARLFSNRDNLGRLHSQSLLLSTQGEAGELAVELQRSYALVQALSKVAAQVVVVSSPDQVFNTMRDEIHKLSLEFAYITIEENWETSSINYASFKTSMLKPLEKLVGQSFIGFTLPRAAWPPIVDELEDQYPVFVSDFAGAIWPAYQQFAEAVFRAGLGLVGISEKTAGIFIPIKFSDESSGIMVVWGDTLRQQDVSAFSVFGSQVCSAIEQARLIETEQERLRKSEQSNALIHALNKVAASASSSYNPHDVLVIIADELGKLDLNFYLCVTDVEHQFAEIQFVSPDIGILRQVERLFGDAIVGYKMPRIQWPQLAVEAYEQKKAVFVQDFAGDVNRLFYEFPDWMAQRTLNLVGIDHHTAGIHAPHDLLDGTTAVLSIWGTSIIESDLPTFSIFASQVASSYEQARLHEAKQQHALELERSNALLSVLSRITARASPAIKRKELLAIMTDEFKALNLDFVYLYINREKGEATIEHTSLESGLLDQLRKIANITVEGRRIPEKLWPSVAIQASKSQQPFFLPNFSDYLLSLFRGPSKSILYHTQQLAGISKQTSGAFLPMTLGDGLVILIGVWGESLRQKDLAALQVYASQMESLLENSRLFHLAEQEISERRLTQEALLTSREEYRGLFENAHDAIIIFDPATGDVLDANQRATLIYGYNHEEFTQIQLDSITENVAAWRKAIAEILTSKRKFNFEIAQFRKDGTRMDMEVNAGIVTFKGKQAIQSIHRDVTERNKMEARLRHDTLHDALTGLPNRNLFLDRLGHVIAHSSRSQDYHFAVLFIDLDHFKDINDSMGHIAGDRLLIDISERLKASTRATDTVARMGGDEFVILLEDVPSVHDVIISCERILDSLMKSFGLSNNEVIVTASIGVVIGSPLYATPEEYLRDADIAMYRAKAGGRSRFEIFDVAMRTSVLERLQLEADLRRAITQNEFFLLYQPIYMLRNQKLEGFEALIRWQRPDNRGLISPTEFIPAAESLGMINEIGHWVLEKACLQLQIWKKEYSLPDSFKMNINISAIQLLSPDFAKEVSAIIEQTGVSPANLALEITETAFIHDQYFASQQVSALKALGVQIHLDDFGTGYSSLSLINDFQIDALKIERQFISDLKPGKRAELVTAIIALGEKLELNIIAEGIETQDQLDFLNQNFCALGQGHFFSKPISAQDAGDLLTPG